MMEFIISAILTKFVLQVIIIEKNCDNWKRSWLLKNILIIYKIIACDKIDSVAI